MILLVFYSPSFYSSFSFLSGLMSLMGPCQGWYAFKPRLDSFVVVCFCCLMPFALFCRHFTESTVSKNMLYIVLRVRGVLWVFAGKFNSRKKVHSDCIRARF